MELRIPSSAKPSGAREKTCMTCRNAITPDVGYLYNLSFCCEDCRDVYMGRKPAGSKPVKKEHHVLLPSRYT